MDSCVEIFEEGWFRGTGEVQERYLCSRVQSLERFSWFEQGRGHNPRLLDPGCVEENEGRAREVPRVPCPVGENRKYLCESL